MPEFDPTELIGEFQDEARSQLDRLDATLLHVDREGRLPEQDRADIQRALHTLKGNAAMIGLGPLRDFVHEIETAFKAPREWHRALIDELFAAAATARQAVERLDARDPEKAMEGLHPPQLPTESGTGGETVPEEGSRSRDADRADRPEPGGEAAADSLRAEAAAETVRVHSRHLDSMLEQVGELVGLRVRMDEWVRTHREALRSAGIIQEARDHAERLGLFADRMRESVMELRTVPTRRILTRFQTLGRELAAAQGKRVRVELSGEEAEVDKNVLEGLAEPLLHLVRNAVDHGIETPETRERRGKDPEGVIRISVSRKGDVAEIVVEDDGRGLDIEALRESAEARGMEAFRSATGRDALQRIIFQPGFSSREEVTDVSGRGVGLDVVRSSILRLHGTVAVETGREMAGAAFVIRVPVSMAILPTLLFELGAEPLAVPAGEVVESIRRPRLDRIGKIRTLRHHGEDVPLVDLASLFGWDGAPSAAPPFAVLLQAGARIIAIPADRMIEHRRSVVRPIPPALGRIPGISGATVLPSGRPALLLDSVGVADLNLEYLDAAADDG